MMIPTTKNILSKRAGGIPTDGLCTESMLVNIKSLINKLASRALTDKMKSDCQNMLTNFPTTDTIIAEITARVKQGLGV
ncbi:MAG TPA: hypothetical protein VFE46_06165 [Pirellulales bacterium]|jgi:hypothetical protein|nr:hypothetical protein [Pirellulales bacterium]